MVVSVSLGRPHMHTLTHSIQEKDEVQPPFLHSQCFEEFSLEIWETLERLDLTAYRYELIAKTKNASHTQFFQRYFKCKSCNRS